MTGYGEQVWVRYMEMEKKKKELNRHSLQWTAMHHAIKLIALVITKVAT